MEEIKYKILEIDNAGETTYKLLKNEDNYLVLAEEIDGTVTLSQDSTMFGRWIFLTHLDYEGDKKFKYIAMYLFRFLWNSDNGVCTSCDKEIFEDDFSKTNITWEDCKAFVKWATVDFKEHLINGAWFDSDDEVYIDWDYFTHFLEGFIFSEKNEKEYNDFMEGRI